MTPIIKTHKVGLNRGRRRIWLDGPTLDAIGFISGQRYVCYAEPGKLHLVIPHFSFWGLRENGYTKPKEGETIRKVSGSVAGKSIIDITGRTVDTAFPSTPRVQVKYSNGEILITPAP